MEGVFNATRLTEERSDDGRSINDQPTKSTDIGALATMEGVLIIQNRLTEWREYRQSIQSTIGKCNISNHQ